MNSSNRLPRPDSGPFQRDDRGSSAVGGVPPRQGSRPLIPDYELLRQIGRGGYGEVWLARSSATGVFRAAKIVWRRTFEDPRPFEREFEGIQKFERISREHPSQLALFHIGRNDAEGYFYYVMELAEAMKDPESEAATPEPNLPTSTVGLLPVFGVQTSDRYIPRTLRADLKRGRLPASEVVEIGLALSEALGHLHRHGLVHRDVKPSNVIFVNGRPKLADIGLVADVGDGQSLVGTEGYLPPEGPGTPQGDLFALGKVLYEAATGLDRQGFPQLPSDLRAWPDATVVLELNEVLLRVSAPDPRQRYQTAERLHADLALLHSGQSVKRLRAVERRLAFFTRLAVVVGLVAVIALGILYEAHRRAQIAAHSLVLLHVEKGARLLDERDLFGSLLEFTEALRLDGGDLGREESHRIRVASVLRECPRLVGLFAHPDGPINDAAFSPDSRRVVTASEDHTARVWDLGTGGQLFSLPHTGIVYSATFSPNGHLIATSSSDGRVHMWNAGNGQALLQSPIRHRGRSVGPHPCFTPDGGRLVTITDGRTLRIWDPVTGQPRGQPLQHGRNVSSFVISPDGRHILTLTSDEWAWVWDAVTGAAVGQFRHEGRVTSGAFSPDGRMLATGGEDETARFWDLASAKATGPTLVHPDGVVGVEFSPEGRRLATIDKARTVRIWDVGTGRLLARPLLHDSKVLRADFSPDGRWLATASEGNRVRLWDTDTGQMLGPPFVHNTPRGPARFSPDGHLVLTVQRDLTLQRDKVVMVWNLAKTESPPLPIPPATSFRQVSKSADGRFAAMIRGNRIETVRLSSGRLLCQPLTQAAPFRQVCFSADNGLLLTESSGARGRVWDLSSGEPLTPLLRIRYDLAAHGPAKADLSQDIRPVAELVSLAELLSGNRVDETGGVQPVSERPLASAWNRLRRKYSETFSDFPEDTLAWHEQEASACEQACNWWSALFHLEILVAASPGDRRWEQRRAYARLALDRANNSAGSYLEQRRATPPRNPLASRRLIDLSRFYNQTNRIGGDWLAGLPFGLRTFAGTEFDVRGVVLLSGRDSPGANSLPREIRGITVNQKCHRLRFLHATASDVTEDTEVGSYLATYADQQTRRVPIVYGRDVRSWWTAPNEPLLASDSVLAWIGSNREAEANAGRSLRLFVANWENPRPHVEVETVDFLSGETDAQPFLAAMTAE
ncbi:MAG TPA: protein kinase [Verrucomicrobiae bacterium]